MIAQSYQLYVERIDAKKNMARYYAMSIEPNLFGEACLIRRWGRIGTVGQKREHHFAREEEAVSFCERDGRADTGRNHLFGKLKRLTDSRGCAMGQMLSSCGWHEIGEELRILPPLPPGTPVGSGNCRCGAKLRV
jgi:predicted DNA-binding WGR domain protein